jgi:hypothetical protein
VHTANAGSVVNLTAVGARPGGLYTVGNFDGMMGGVALPEEHPALIV